MFFPGDADVTVQVACQEEELEPTTQRESGVLRGTGHDLADSRPLSRTQTGEGSVATPFGDDVDPTSSLILSKHN